ncbi:MAG: hypothetical protein GY857_08935 [Desulfobacula sp.]|nr:hypothetical protein [Desulfobacula sp.]
MKKNNKILITLVVGLGIILLAIVYYNKPQQDKVPDTLDNKNIAQNHTTSIKDINSTEKGVVQKEIIVLPDLDYKNLKKDKTLKKLMGSRKENLGIKKSLDMIVKSNESFTIGDNKISMRDILEKAFIKEGSVFEEKIENSGAVLPQKIKEYGIYVVQPGDNIWNIHFNILKEFYEHKGINVSPKADEPVDSGMSSGVGKILKFSETMVIIYNLVEKKVASDIDLLEPLSKIVVYNMDEVFSLLFEVNYDNIARIQFDGKTIWIPAKKQ